MEVVSSINLSMGKNKLLIRGAKEKDAYQIANVLSISFIVITFLARNYFPYQVIQYLFYSFGCILVYLILGGSQIKKISWLTEQNFLIIE